MGVRADETRMVFELQPNIVMNNRNLATGDFSTPEQRILASGNGRAWESCMTLNESWGYDAEDADGVEIAADSGTQSDLVRAGWGKLPAECRAEGRWHDAGGGGAEILDRGGAAGWRRMGIRSFKSDRCQPWRPSYATFTRTGNTLYMHVHFWPGGDVSLSGLQTKVKSAWFMKSKQPIKFTQDEVRVHLTGLPMAAPDTPVTTIAIECESVPTQNLDPELRLQKPRGGVGMKA